jgi:hypothetical protein
MSKIEIHDRALHATLQGGDVVRAHLRTLSIPLGAIEAVSIGIPAVALREPSTLWGSYDAGEMLVGNVEASEGGRESFFEVRNPERAVTLELSRGRFAFVVLEPTNTDPERLVRDLRAALGHPLPEAHLPPDLMPGAPLPPHDRDITPEENTPMNKPTIDPTTPVNPAAARPAWWNDAYTSDWDRVKEALRRDWEQTKADFSIGHAVELNQNAADTIKQAVGNEPVPPPMVKTRADTPSQVADQVEKNMKEQLKAEGHIAEARTDMAVERVRTEAKVAEAKAEAEQKIAKAKAGAQEKFAKEQEKIAEMRTDAYEKIADVRAKAGDEISKKQEKVDDARRDWSRAEQAMRYGFGAQRQYTDERVWNDKFEDRLRREWTELKNESTWEDVRPYVRQGWDYAVRTPAS